MAAQSTTMGSCVTVPLSVMLLEFPQSAGLIVTVLALVVFSLFVDDPNVCFQVSHATAFVIAESTRVIFQPAVYSLDMTLKAFNACSLEFTQFALAVFHLDVHGSSMPSDPIQLARSEVAEPASVVDYSIMNNSFMLSKVVKPAESAVTAATRKTSFDGLLSSSSVLFEWDIADVRPGNVAFHISSEPCFVIAEAAFQYSCLVIDFADSIAVMPDYMAM